MNEIQMIPIFPLKLVLLPDGVLPLHIFEPRYKEMIAYCLRENVEFGLVYSAGNEIRKVGCTAQITKVIKEYDDGRMDIVTKGKNRFRIKNISEEETYFQASVVYFDDEEETETPEMVEFVHQGIELLKEIETVTGSSEEQYDLGELNIRVMSFLIANSTVIPDYRKQEFLEMTSTSERISAEVKDLKEALKNLKLISEFNKAAKIPQKVHGFYVN